MRKGFNLLADWVMRGGSTQALGGLFPTNQTSPKSAHLGNWMNIWFAVSETGVFSISLCCLIDLGSLADCPDCGNYANSKVYRVMKINIPLALAYMVDVNWIENLG